MHKHKEYDLFCLRGKRPGCGAQELPWDCKYCQIFTSLCTTKFYNLEINKNHSNTAVGSGIQG